MIIVSLLVTDVIIVFVELFFGAEYPSCDLIKRDGVSCCPAADGGQGSGHRLLGESMYQRGLAAVGSEHHSLCAAPLVEAADAIIGCDEHKWAAVHTAHTALFACSVAILSLFQVELLCLVVVLGADFFFNPLYVVDLIVVTLSLTLELVLFSLGQEHQADLVSALIFARVWRFMRVAHGLLASAHEISHHHIEDLEDSVGELDSELRILLDYSARLEEQVAPEKAKELRAETVRKLGVSSDQLDRATSVGALGSD